MYFTESGSPQWESITEELRSAEMPLRRWLAAKLPNTKPCFVEFRKAIRNPCIEPPRGIPAGTAGAAFDFLLRYRLSDDDPADLAVVGAVFADQTQECVSALIELAADLLTVARDWKSSTQHRQTAPPVRLVRGCWVLALFTELLRGVPVERSPLAMLGSAPKPGALFALVPEPAIDDLAQLYAVTSNTLIPFTSRRPGAVTLAPTFSKLIAGDADLIQGRTLIEVKASVDRRRRDGTPRYSLDSRTLYQVVTYGILGQELFRLDEVAIFNARYSHVYSWDLSELVSQLAGEWTCLDRLSADLDLFLRYPCSPEVPAPAREAAHSIRLSGELAASRRRRERFLTKPARAQTPRDAIPMYLCATGTANSL